MKEIPAEMLVNIYSTPSSVFSDEQEVNFNSMLEASIKLLQELCLNAPTQLKKIVYLAEDILEIAKKIPSVLDTLSYVDMRPKVCVIIHQLAAFASRIEIGMPVNIDKQLNIVRDNCVVS
tara:strand:- start:58 stop:417 length:360 start_codon:yes stop_codon:yes gene_type:complete